MKIDLTCPVELWQYAMPAEDNAECTFIMNNLSDKVVVSVQVTLACFDKEDHLLFRQTERIQGLKAGVGERFSIVLLPSEWRDVEGVDLVIEKVWFDDATIWRKGNAPLTHYTSNALPNGRALDQLRFVAGKDAVGYPQWQDQVWLCVCGRANPAESDRCCRCERRREATFASFSPENVAHVIAAHEQKLAQTARKAREENNLLQEKQEKERAAKRRRRKQATRLGLSALCVAVLAVVLAVWVMPALRYNAAQGLLSDGQFDEARAAFAAMGEYRDARTQVAECDYQEASAALNAGGIENLEKAEAAFAALAEYGDSGERRSRAAYELGCAYLESGSYELAAEKFQALGDYEDSAEKLNEAIYQQACSLLDGGNPVVARVLFQGISTYRDAGQKVLECSYVQGKALLEAGSYADAAEVLSQLGDYEDAASLAGQANYELAEIKFSEGDREAAGRLYLAAGDYGNAAEKANDCLYQLALETKAAGEYEKAALLFLEIVPYLDSEGQAQDCTYLEALELKEAGDYAGAVALVDGLVAHAGAEALADECNYHLAIEAIEAGNLERAEELLQRVATNYEDTARRLRTVRYELAETALAEGRYEDASARYEALGNYSDSAAKLKQCRYAIASAALTAGDFATAISGFEALGSYKDSKTMLEEARYQQALSLKAAGDTQGAIEALSAAGSSDRAKSELISLQMEEAAALEAAGDLEGAAAAYEAIEGSAEAQERANACRYQLAEKLRESGDLPGAGAAFAALGNYSDAKAQSAACYETYFGGMAQTARDAMEKKDYQAAVAALESFSLEGLSGDYADLNDLYLEACYQYAEALYRDGKPYEALAYYQRVGDYRDTAEKKLERRAYLILGEWTSSTGKTAAFYTDGTCDLMGEKLCFRVSNFSLYTGETPDSMTITHKLSAIDKTYMSLRDIRDGQDVVYKFDRVGEWTLPEPAAVEAGAEAGAEAAPEATAQPASEATEPASVPTAQPTKAPGGDELDEMLVTDDGDEANP